MAAWLPHGRTNFIRLARQRVAVVGLACCIALVAGCATRSPTSILPPDNADRMNRCPLDQSMVCSVGWPSRVKAGNRDKSCHCS